MKYRIYVIEDDENIRNLICVALENFGYCASGFETAEEALDNLSALLRRGREAQREYPAMFVFDWMLPGMGKGSTDDCRTPLQRTICYSLALYTSSASAVMENGSEKAVLPSVMKGTGLYTDYNFVTLVAWGPFAPFTTSNSTSAPSSRDLKPSMFRPE